MTDFWGRIPLEFAGGRLDYLNFALHLAAEAHQARGKAQIFLDPVVGLGTLGILTQHADFLGQDGDLTDFELEMISGGQFSQSSS